MAEGEVKPPSTRLHPKHAHALAFEHATPAHTPNNSQHSLQSSTSSRSPLHTLSLHEYRKLQNTPPPQSATPPSKPLRRKAAASALNGLERTPLVKRASVAQLRPSSRPLHFSRSSDQLTSHQHPHQPLPPSPPHFSEHTALLDSSYRSQSAEPRDFPARSFGYSAGDSQHRAQKVNIWNPIKRLPKPDPANPSAQFPPPSSVFSAPFHTTPTSSTENVPSSGAQITPSTFSLSRFPRPPNLAGPSFFSQNDKNAQPLLNKSFSTTAPATPPATPAVIHYRGASFDLVNPHDSLLFHDIETPSRDLDSTEYMSLRMSEDSLEPPEMAPRRPLYTDLSAAYSSIRRRDDISATPNSEVLVPPAPALLSPESSSYSSPENTYQSSLAVSPLAVKKAPTDSRFSLKDMTSIKNLTRSFTKKLGKSPEPTTEHELQTISPSPTSPAIAQFEGTYPRPLDQSYSTPFPADFRASQRTSRNTGTANYPPDRRVSSAPLASILPASMTPDDPSTDMGRLEGTRLSVVTDDRASKAYYDQLEVGSLYASSSVYNGDGEGGNPPSISSRRVSNVYGLSDFADYEEGSPYNPDSLYSYSNTNRDSTLSSSNARRASGQHPRKSAAANYRESRISRNPKTDTISNFINQYDDPEGADATQNASVEGEKRQQAFKVPSGLSQADADNRNASPIVQDACRARKPNITQGPGSPPHFSAPLAPAFEYDEVPFSPPNPSQAFSGASSYGDTRYLLQMVPESSNAPGNTVPTAMGPSSSYSQSEGMTHSSTPQEALDEAEKIFGNAENEDIIPAMWGRRVSGNLIQKNRQSTIAEGTEDEDWETVGNNSRHSQAQDSFADFSDDPDEISASQAIYGDGPIPREVSLGFYTHPSPISHHDHPFSSSPPHLSGRELHDSRATFGSSSPQHASTVPLFQSTTRRYGEDPTRSLSRPEAVWSSPYEFSDKVTQELLASGPNEEILYDADCNIQDDRKNRHNRLSGVSSEDDGDGQPILSPFHDRYNSVMLERENTLRQLEEPEEPMEPDERAILERENTFLKLSEVGSKENLTGTPGGTGMRAVGSSIADTSSPGAEWSPGYAPKKKRPVGEWGPRLKESPSKLRAGYRRDSYARSPGGDGIEALPQLPKVEPSPSALKKPKSSRSIKSITSSIRSHGHNYGRSAVPGQTKLRQMMLAPGPESGHRQQRSSIDTQFSWFLRGGTVRPDGVCEPGRPDGIVNWPYGPEGRPDTANTEEPLRPISTQEARALMAPSIVHSLTPHLRLPDHVADPDPSLDSERKKWSWILFAMFCILPPLLMLYRWYADRIIDSASRGRLGSASMMPKKCSLWIGGPLNILIVIAIVVPILVAHAA